MIRIDPHVYIDLLGKPYAESTCWECALTVLRRLGMDVRGWTDDWQPVDRPLPGDLVSCDFGSGPHVAVYLGENRLLHSTSAQGVITSPLDAAERAGAVKSFARWAGRREETEDFLDCDGRPSDVTVVWFPDIFKPTRREIIRIRWEGGPLSKYLPSEANVIASPNGGVEKIPDREAQPGEIVTCSRAPADVNFLTLGIGLALSLIAQGLQLLLNPAVAPGKEKAEIASPSFDLSGLKNTAVVGIAQPIVYGQPRAAGNIISAFQLVDSQDRSILYLTLLISRGPITDISGITSDVNDLYGDNIPTSIQIDGSPAKNYGAYVSIRLGNIDQDPLPALDVTRTVTTYAETLQVGTPFGHTTSQAVDGFELHIQYPLGLYNLSNSSGALGPRTVTITVEYRRLGTTTYTLATFAHTAARRGDFSRMIRIVGLTRDVYEIRITRIAPPWPETAADHESKSVLTDVNEIVNDQISYGGLALLHVQIPATDQLSGNLPNITCVPKGRKVYVWDGVSTTAPTFGSGLTYTDNPAWCVVDMLINPNDGLAKNGALNLNNINLTSFASWATLCDTLVSDGRGGTTKRATLDIVIDERQSGWELINQIANSHFARIVMASNEIRVVPEQDQTPCFVASMGNISDVTVSYAGRRSRRNAVEVQFLNEEADFQADQALQIDEASLITSGEAVSKESIQAVGVTRASQAHRLARLRLNYHKFSKRRIQFRGGPEFLHLLPGDVGYVQHDSLSVGIGGRVLSATATTVKLDHSLTIAGGSRVAITVWHDNDSIETWYASGPATYARNAAITIEEAIGGGSPTWTRTPSAGARYAVGPLTGVSQLTKRYQILSIETSHDLTRHFTCAENSSDIYSDDPGVIESFTDTMPDPRIIPENVTKLVLEDAGMLSNDGGTVEAVRASWTPNAAWDFVDIFYRVPDWAEAGPIPWRFAARTTGNEAIIPMGGYGLSIEVAAVPFSKQGSRRDPELSTKASFCFRGRREPPTSPSTLAATVAAGVLTAVVGKISDPSVAGYQFRYGTTWAGSVVLAEMADNVLVMPCPWVGTVTLRARTISRTGVISASEVTLSVTHTLAASVYTKDRDANEHTAFAGTKTNTAVTASELHLSGSNLTGTYQTADASPYLDVGQQMVAIRCVGGLANVARTWDDCAFRWDDATDTWDSFYLNGREVTSRPLRWDDCGFTWDSLPAVCLTWDGPIDIIGALAPTIEYDTNINGAGFSGSWTKYRGPFEAPTLTSVRSRITLARPHANYDPKLSEVNITTAALGANEPERFTLDFEVSAATAVNAVTVGMVISGNTSAGFKVPTAKILTILSAEGSITSGPTAGTTTADLVLYNDTAGSAIVLATGSTAAINTQFWIQASGTRTAPLGTLAAGNKYRIGWFNRNTSPGALSNVPHHVRLVAIYEDA